LANKELAEVLVTLVEALDPTCRVHDALLACVERVASGADLNVIDRVGVSVFSLHCLVAGEGGTG